ncbi:hypothetical protein ACHHYP_12675 [Achlya hypogyna]|uniref:R3H domain-containing protein n=1 Tax=Achlya hypogyna TaxID=1202772 RepID=A0A1V9ZGL7_ACHHY|nr:hypothetical protein ACHHYP_12675 [Achlya hypogyna]
MAEPREQAPAAAARTEDDWELAAEEAVTQKLGKMQLQRREVRLARPDEAAWGSGDDAPSTDLASPVSRGGAAAVSAASSAGPMDPVLVAALENPRERLTLLKFEDQIVSFIRAEREMQLVFPPLSSYHRLIVHRLADRCSLEHQTADYYPYNGGYDNNAARVVTLFRTPRCAVPSVLLIDLSAEQAQLQPPAHHTIAPKIMTRNPNRDKQKKNTKAPAVDTRTRNLQDREKAYAEARARIFGQDEVPEAPKKPTAKPAKAPAAEKPRPQNWKESKVTWRNREQEMNDPDFTRHRAPYRGPPTYQQPAYYAPRPVVSPNEYNRGDYTYRQVPLPTDVYQPPPRPQGVYLARPQPDVAKPNVSCPDEFPPLGQ